MQHYRRSIIPGASYFFTVATQDRQEILTQAEVYNALETSMRTVGEIYPFKIDAFVILPDHLHCLWTLPEGDHDYANRWSIIKRKVSQAIEMLASPKIARAKETGREHYLWQRRMFEHQVRDDDDFEMLADYIHRNPLKHGYVNAVAEWPYSSFHRYVKEGAYALGWCGCAEPDGMAFGEI